MKTRTSELLLVAARRGRNSCWGHASGSVCERDAAPAVCQGNKYLRRVVCPVPVSLLEHRLVAKEPFPRLYFIHEGVSEGSGAGKEGERRLKAVFLFNLGPFVSSKPVSSAG